jgi:hypothetical protein
MSRGFFVLSISLVSLPALGAEPEAVLPALVIQDANNEVMAPVVGFATRGQYPIIRLLDPTLSHPVFVQVVNTDTLEAGNNQTWFADDGCTGAAFHKPALSNTDQGVASLTGFTYSVANLGPGEVQWLFRSNTSVAGTAGTAFKSKFAPFLDPKCNETDGTDTLRPATTLQNLDNEYPPPYHLP